MDKREHYLLPCVYWSIPRGDERIKGSNNALENARRCLIPPLVFTPLNMQMKGPHLHAPLNYLPPPQPLPLHFFQPQLSRWVLIA